MNNTFIDRFIKTPPVLFPLVALFHIAMLGFSIYSASAEPLTSIIWLDVAWMLAFSIAWLLVCSMKSWAAYTYIAIVAIDMLVHFVAKSSQYESSLFLIDIIFAMILMAYIKRFN